MKKLEFIKSLLLVFTTSVTSMFGLTSAAKEESDADRLERLVNEGKKIEFDTFILDRDVYLNKPFYCNNCLFVSSGKKKRHIIHINDKYNLTKNIFNNGGMRYKEPVEVLNFDGSVTKTHSLFTKD